MGYDGNGDELAAWVAENSPSGVRVLLQYTGSVGTNDFRTDASSVQPGKKLGVPGGFCTSSYQAVLGPYLAAVTAGHCGSPGQTIGIWPSQTNIGSVAETLNHNNSPADTLIAARAGITAASNDVVTSSDAQYHSITNFGESYSSYPAASQGNVYCFSGVRAEQFGSPETCGSLNSLHTDVNYGSGLVIRNLVAVNACSRDGDSGSPVYDTRNTRAFAALGTLSGGNATDAQGGSSGDQIYCAASPLMFFTPWESTCRMHPLLEPCGNLPEPIVALSSSTPGSPTVDGTANKDVVGSFLTATGDFDCDGHDDILWYTASGADTVWYGNGGNSFSGYSGLQIAGSYDTVIAGDFNADGCDDLLFYAPGAAADFIRYGSPGKSFPSQSLSVNGTYKVAVGDFDNNSYTDIFWYGSGTALDYVWWFDAGSSSYAPSYTSGTQLVVNGVYDYVVGGQFDGNAGADLFFYAAGTAADFLRRGNVGPSTAFGAGVQMDVAGDYRPVVGKLNAGGIDDIFWHDGNYLAQNVRYFGSTTGTKTATTYNSNLLVGRYAPFAGNYSNANGPDVVFMYRAG